MFANRPLSRVYNALHNRHTRFQMNIKIKFYCVFHLFFDYKTGFFSVFYMFFNYFLIFQGFLFPTNPILTVFNSIFQDRNYFDNN